MSALKPHESAIVDIAAVLPRVCCCCCGILLKNIQLVAVRSICFPLFQKGGCFASLYSSLAAGQVVLLSQPCFTIITPAAANKNHIGVEFQDAYFCKRYRAIAEKPGRVSLQRAEVSLAFGSHVMPCRCHSVRLVSCSILCVVEKCLLVRGSCRLTFQQLS